MGKRVFQRDGENLTHETSRLSIYLKPSSPYSFFGKVDHRKIEHYFAGREET